MLHVLPFFEADNTATVAIVIFDLVYKGVDQIYAKTAGGTCFDAAANLCAAWHRIRPVGFFGLPRDLIDDLLMVRRIGAGTGDLRCPAREDMLNDVGRSFVDGKREIMEGKVVETEARAFVCDKFAQFGEDARRCRKNALYAILFAHEANMAIASSTAGAIWKTIGKPSRSST